MSDLTSPGSPRSARGAAHAKPYALVFVVLGALTLVELGVAGTAGSAKGAVVVALLAIAIAKASLIALFYMHLRFETPILRLTVLGPLVAPAVYGLVLIAETSWRLLR
jgi:cytochrome c oxidase subunit 4